jgi:hypothetical protein
MPPTPGRSAWGQTACRRWPPWPPGGRLAHTHACSGRKCWLARLKHTVCGRCCACSCAVAMATPRKEQTAVAGTTGWSPQQAAELLLALVQAVEHQPLAAAALSSTASDGLSRGPPSSSLAGRHQHLVQQLQMLVQPGAPRCTAAPAAAPQAAGGGAAGPCFSACCSAQLSVLRSLTGLVLAARNCAANPDLLRGERCCCCMSPSGVLQHPPVTHAISRTPHGRGPGAAASGGSGQPSRHCRKA